MNATWLLLHDDEPIAIATISPAAIANSQRNRIFGKSKWKGKTINRLFCNISRIVIDPRYRGAGIAGDFLLAVCRQAPTRYVELVTSMGQSTPFWRKAGFVDYGGTSKHKNNAKGESYGKTAMGPTRAAVKAQSKVSTMRYYLCDTQTLGQFLVRADVEEPQLAVGGNGSSEDSGVLKDELPLPVSTPTTGVPPYTIDNIDSTDESSKVPSGLRDFDALFGQEIGSEGIDSSGGMDQNSAAEVGEPDSVLDVLHATDNQASPRLTDA